jgi:hypothetical protein
MFMRLCVLLLVLLTCWSCNNSKTPNYKTVEYFDNAGFFEREAKRMSDLKTQETKTVQTNGTSETIQITDVDWEKELGVFKQITLNKSSFSGKYSIDSSIVGGVKTTHYSCLDKKLPIRYLAFGDSLGKIVWIESKSHENSELTNTEMFWRFVPDSGYMVNGRQTIFGGAESSFTISANFEN